MVRKYPKILVISAWYPNDLHHAEGDFIRHQSELISREGVDISVFHVSMSIKYLARGLFFEKVTQNKNGLNEYIVEMPFWPRNNSWGTKQWATQYAKKAIEYCTIYGWPDVIHAHTYLGGFVAKTIKEKHNIPYVITLHESFLVSNNIPHYHIPLIRDALNNANQVFAVGDNLARRMKNYSEAHVKVVPNFIDFDLFHISEEKSKPFTFIFIGELIERKRVDVLINAFCATSQKVSGANLVIVGNGPKFDSLQRLVSNLGIEDKVRFTGRLSQQETAKILCNSHCLILPSKSESFGIVLAEAMACGLPFISTKSGVPESQFNHAACRFIGFEENELAEELEKVMVIYEGYDAQDIRKYGQDRFSGKAVVQIYIKKYSSLTK